MTHLLYGVGRRSGALLEQPAERRGSDRSDTGASQPHVTDDGGAGTGTEFRPARWEKEMRMLGMIMKVPQKMRTIRIITYTTSLSSGAIRSLLIRTNRN